MSFIIRAKMRTAFRIMRFSASLPESVHTPAPQAPTTTQPQVITVSGAPPQPAPGEIAEHDMVAMSETVSQTSVLKVRLLSPAAIKQCNRQYVKVEGVDPPSGRDLSPRATVIALCPGPAMWHHCCGLGSLASPLEAAAEEATL